ncbi:MAG: hypothetical protein V7637_279 [Mycobacteriales bacterium]|jgi:membrane protein YqaA with SNARE-associated domain
MSTEPRHARATGRLTAGRVLARFLLTIVGIVVALVLFFNAEDMFTGYPQVGSQYISWAVLFLTCATGAVAWIVDHRRLPSLDDSGVDTADRRGTDADE